jgi:hypothetical protein
MKLRWTFVLVLSIVAGWFLQSSVPAGDKKATEPEKKKSERAQDVVVNGELINADLKDKILTESYCKTYTYKMTKGRLYQIDLISQAFDAYLRLENPKGTQVAADDDSGGMLNARIIYRAPETGDFTICAMSLGGGSTGKFMLVVKDTTPEKVAAPGGKVIELKNEKGKATHTGNLTKDDPVYKNKKHKLFTFNMEEGKTYQIDMKSGALDSYLYLESPDGDLLDQDDDGGGFPDARITHKAAKTGKHRIICTYFGSADAGEFTLTIEEKK